MANKTIKLDIEQNRKDDEDSISKYFSNKMINPSDLLSGGIVRSASELSYISKESYPISQS